MQSVLIKKDIAFPFRNLRHRLVWNIVCEMSARPTVFWITISDSQVGYFYLYQKFVLLFTVQLFSEPWKYTWIESTLWRNKSFQKSHNFNSSARKAVHNLQTQTAILFFAMIAHCYKRTNQLQFRIYHSLFVFRLMVMMQKRY